MPIFYHIEPPLQYTIQAEEYLTTWLQQIVANEGNFTLQTLNFIFCTDEYLYNMNVNYLNHDTYTDVITFDNADEAGIIEGDIFISIERVKENANQLSISLEEELYRVMAHGVLHLLGYKDKEVNDQHIMREAEEKALVLYRTLAR